MFAFLRNLLAQTQASGKSAAKRRPRITLQLEALEDRLTPTTFTAPVGVIPTGPLAPENGYKPFVVSGNTLNVYGTAGNDNFDFTAGASSNKVTLNGASYNVNPALIHNINFYGDGGIDHATLTDTLNFAHVTLNPHSATMNGSTPGAMTGPNYVVNLNNTASVLAFGRSGDTATFSDSAGNDTFYSGGKSAGMYDSNSTYLNIATGFSYNSATSSNGGTDIAKFYDTPGNDIYTGSSTSASMHDSGNTYSNSAVGFGQTYAYSSAGGTDTAILNDSTTYGGFFDGVGSQASLMGANVNPNKIGYDNITTGFKDVVVNGSNPFHDSYQFDGPINYTLHMNGPDWEQTGV